MKYNSFVKEMDQRLCPDESFDIVKRELIIGERDAVLYFVDGFIKDEVYEKMLEFLFSITSEQLSKIGTMERFKKNKMPYVEVDDTDSAAEAALQVLSGVSVLVIDGVSGALLADTRTYPTRGIEEPQKDKSLRGPRDGFIETLVFNLYCGYLKQVESSGQGAFREAEILGDFESHLAANRSNP